MTTPTLPLVMALEDPQDRTCPSCDVGAHEHCRKRGCDCATCARGREVVDTDWRPAPSPLTVPCPLVGCEAAIGKPCIEEDGTPKPDPHVRRRLVATGNA